jgi:hypothetical protein
MRRHFLLTFRTLCAVVLLGCTSSFSQEHFSWNPALSSSQRDTNIVFESPRGDLSPVKPSLYLDAWGLEILVSNNGFGLGGFYRHQYTNELFGTMTLAV